MRTQIELLTQEMRANSEQWFPRLHDGSGDLPLPASYALGLGGEAGEALNLVKKMYRDGATEGLAAELADTMTYLFLLAAELGVDLVEAYRAKVEVNVGRWG